MAKHTGSPAGDGFRGLMDKLVQEREAALEPQADHGYESPEDVPDREWHRYWDNQWTPPVQPLIHFPHG